MPRPPHLDQRNSRQPPGRSPPEGLDRPLAAGVCHRHSSTESKQWSREPVLHERLWKGMPRGNDFNKPISPASSFSAFFKSYVGVVPYHPSTFPDCSIV